VGSVEVFYTEERPVFEEGPFLKEERDLIDAIAYKLGLIIAQRSMEEALNKSHNEKVAILEGDGRRAGGQRRREIHLAQPESRGDLRVR
jgi:GAF domain-containing protein